MTANYCCLCGEDRAHGKKLFMGIKGAICTECVTLCAEIIAEDARSHAEGAREEPPQHQPQPEAAAVVEEQSSDNFR